MGLRGPAPAPLELVKARGNPGKAKLPANELKFKPVAPKCPPWLSATAKAEWKRLAPQMERLSILTEADLAAFACYCQAYSDLISATQILAEKGRTFETVNGYIMPRPEVAMANQAMKAIKDFAVQFGFTPSARSRIDLKPGDADGDEDLD